MDVQKIDNEKQFDRTISNQGEITIPSDGRLAQVIARGDGKQIVTLSSGKSEQEFRFKFGEAFLEDMGGYALVRDKKFEEPYQIIDPAWAQDAKGKKVVTRYEIEGDTLV